MGDPPARFGSGGRDAVYAPLTVRTAAPDAAGRASPFNIPHQNAERASFSSRTFIYPSPSSALQLL
ncbi:MAG: hypothetical protein ACREVC_01415 [Burkholderiales bacterium]